MGIQLVVASGSRAGQVIPIVGERFVIGRAEDCNLKPRSELISRYHCEIFSDDGSMFVRDMGSKNGVFLNGRKITETNELNNGDKLVIGPLEFLVHLASEAKPQQHRPTKPPKVKSVSDAVARTVALQSENLQKNTDDTITDWLLAAGENGDEVDTRTVDASELLVQLHAQSARVDDPDGEDIEDEPPRSGIINPGSSRDAASELLRKFFQGGK